jgi:hypothetical protein
MMKEVPVAEPWVRRRILIWGKTRPEMSQKYRETVCTGGVFADTKELVRIYPIPLRYLDDTSQFAKYQWIEADVQRSSDRDSRPESYRIRTTDMRIDGKIDTERGTWAKRSEWVITPQSVVQSVEALQEAQRQTGRSLGLLKPKEVTAVRPERLSRAERDDYWNRYRAHCSQLNLNLGDEAELPRPLTPPDYRFKIEFRCDDTRCRSVHSFSVLDWEVDALYFRQKQNDRSSDIAARDVVHKIEEYCATDKDARFFLGNISTHPQTFTIVGLWHPKKARPKTRRPTPPGSPGLFE